MALMLIQGQKGRMLLFAEDITITMETHFILFGILGILSMREYTQVITHMLIRQERQNICGLRLCMAGINGGKDYEKNN